ncbi:MAG TPA: amidophosphoribosyltransferase [Candidatus Paceibacterota bacterium]|jgi:amidophosphoribosyltransferase|nr:amidophosphoribosyltransferase [Candidatus Paceibacterota bacterium]
MNNKLNEKCAVFGIWDGSDAARQAYFGLFALQHRGQEHSGIATTDGSNIFLYKKTGLVSQIYTEEILKELPGFAAIGHNRYSTSRGLGIQHAQPIMYKGKMAFAHNGNLPSAKALIQFLSDRGEDISDCSDSKLMSKAIGAYMDDGFSLPIAVEKAYPLFTGAFSCVALSCDCLVAFRDYCGVRPLVIGKSDKNEIVVASETCAFRTVGAKFLRDVSPGEMVIITKNGIESKILKKAEPKFDIFEFVYFARYDSVIMGKSVYEVRKNFGKILAQEHKKEVDIVIPVPETAIPAAIGYSQELGIPFEMALVKNRYIHRTFIEPTQANREQKVKMKLTPLEETIRGKRVAVVDDSIVRGTTSQQIVKMLFDAGAKEVHFMVSSAPVRFPDFYGIDTPKQVNLISSQRTIEETREYLGATSLSFLSIDGMVKATGLPKENFSLSAFTGVYPIDILERKEEVNYNIHYE